MDIQESKIYKGGDTAREKTHGAGAKLTFLLAKDFPNIRYTRCFSIYSFSKDTLQLYVVNIANNNNNNNQKNRKKEKKFNSNDQTFKRNH